LNALWQRKAAWEYALDALSQLTPTKNNESTSRLAWLLRAERCGTELVPLEQKRNKQGWSKGRPVALKRLHGCAETLPWLLAQDRQAARHIHYTAGYFYDNGRYELDVGAALPCWLGIRRYFWYDAPDIRVDIEYGQVTLVLTEEGNQLSLALSPAISAPQHLVTEKRHRPDWWYTRLATNTAELLPLSAKVCVFLLPPEKGAAIGIRYRTTATGPGRPA
jgi:hypothetical protein